MGFGTDHLNEKKRLIIMSKKEAGLSSSDLHGGLVL